MTDKQTELEFAIPLSDKILGYLKKQTSYRSPEDIGQGIGVDVEMVRTEVAKLYWDRAHGLSRALSDGTRVYYRLSP